MSDYKPFGTTGNPIVDSLQGLQTEVCNRKSLEAKYGYLREALVDIPAASLLERNFTIGSGLVFGIDPRKAKEDRVLFNGMRFQGWLSRMTYMYDPEVPVDALMFNFLNPKIISTTTVGDTLPNLAQAESDIVRVESFDTARLRCLTLQVPVLAIESCY